MTFFVEFLTKLLLSITMKNFLPLLLLIVGGCEQKKEKFVTSDNILLEPKTVTVPNFIGEIVTPAGYTRTPATKNSFAEWLRNVPLKNDKRVFLYNGSIKQNQSAQFAVVDMPVNHKDLQCADVIMKLRAEYLFLYKKYSDIAFMDYANKWYKWNGRDDRNNFDNYLQKVFGWCGSASLDKQLNPVTDFTTIKSGDVFVQGGFPGHAVLVVDVAVDDKGKKIYLLLQGYQPAQDIHVLNNPMNSELSPWYAMDTSTSIITPEWRFNKTDLKTW